MKPENVTAALIVVVALAVLVTIGLVIWRLELGMLYTLALVLVIGVVAALIIAASAFPIRARKGGGPHEREKIIRETKHTHTIDGRQPARPHIITVPAPPGGGMGIFPEILRGAFLAGRRQPKLGASEASGEAEVIEGDVVDAAEDWPGEWNGPIGGTESVTTQK